VSESLSEIIGAAERAVAGGEADRNTLAQLLNGIDLGALGEQDGRSYLAVLLDWLGMRDQAMLALRPVGGGHNGPSAAMPDLAGALAAGHGDYEQARELFMRALSATSGSTLLRAKILVNLAALSLLAGEVESASAWLALAGDACGQFGDPAIDVLLASTEFGIARAHGDLFGQREAVSRLNKATRARVAELGSDHPLALTAVASLAAADFEVAAAEQSVENQERAIAVLEVAAHRLAADLGADHPQALSCLTDLCVADLHLALGSGLMDRASWATRTLESVSQRMAAAVGEEHPRARDAAVNASFARRALENAQAGSVESRGQGLTFVSQEPATPKGRAPRRSDRYRPWSRRQVRVADSWQAPRDQPASVALSPAGNRLAVSVGQRLTVSGIVDDSAAQSSFQLSCALAPGLTWSPDGARLAFRGEDGQGRIVDLSGQAPQFQGFGAVSAIAFAPSGDRVAVLAPSLPGRMTLTMVGPDREVIWERVLTGDRVFRSRSEGVNLVFSPDGKLLACTTGTSSVWVLDAAGQQVCQFNGHSQTVTGLDWVDSKSILSASMDATLRVWRPDDAVSAAVVETVAVAGMAFVRERCTALIWSARGELFAWSMKGTPIQLWDRHPPTRSVAAHFTRFAVSAVDGLLALIDAGETELVLVSDWDRVVSTAAVTTTYANAKVLMLGDSGVGKSGLAMVLAGEEFRATESTHGRRIWTLPAPEDPDSPGANRDIFLWDLAGQPGYRIVHQLYLEGAALAIILFDAKSETAPLAGVQHWARAVRHAHPVAAGGLTTFLVAARADRGGTNVSNQRIEKLMADFGLDDYFRTSAKEGTNIDQLRSRLTATIDWTRIPEVASTTLFAAVRQFVVDQKASGLLLTPVDELCQVFQAAVPSGQQLLAGQDEDDGQEGPDRLISVFEGCISRLESVGLVKRLRFGNYVLLQPELLDAYAGAIVNAARDEPDGLGSILESRVVNVDFPVPSAERVHEQRQERLLVLATLEELLQHELVLREPTREGVQLIFPAAYRVDLPASEIPRGDGVVFRFEGPIQNIYATLVVRLTRSDKFRRVGIWQSAARFAVDTEEDSTAECTIALRFAGEGEAELLVGYDQVPDDLRKQFERFVQAHLDRHATPGSVTRDRQYSCPDDGIAFTQEQVRQAIRRGRLGLVCPVCKNWIPLLDDDEAGSTDQYTAAMDVSADASREIAAATAVLRGKEEVEEYDVFLSHNWRDKEVVRRIAQQLRDRGLRPWLDERQLRPGFPWQLELEEVIARIPAAAVIIGAQRGPWQTSEMSAFIQQSVSRGCAIVPVLLPDANTDDLPVFLQGLTWVDLAVPEPDPIDRLVWGITGQQPHR